MVPARGARLYLPELGRWASADSVTPDLVWEANAFAYVRNTPLKYVDPDGHFAFLIPVIIWAAEEIGTEALIQLCHKLDPTFGKVVSYAANLTQGGLVGPAALGP